MCLLTFTQNDLYWRIRTPTQLITPIEGDELQYFWYDLPPNIDAAYERYHDQRIIFFKGKKSENGRTL